MQAVKSKDTVPEMTVRRALHSLGYRYRIHGRDLPGCPDIVFPGRRKAIFIHGCFWHGHPCARGARQPKTNASYWTAKISRNRTRDLRVKRLLRAAGWDVFIAWECQTKALQRLIPRIERFLA